MTSSEEEIQIKWIVREDTVDGVKSKFEEHGGNILGEPEEIYPGDIGEGKYGPYTGGNTEFAPPLVILAVALGVGVLMTVVSDIVLDHTYPGGSVWDIRGENPIHWSDPTLERGTIMVISNEGPQIFHPSQRHKGLAVLEGIFRGKNVDKLLEQVSANPKDK